MKKALLIGGLIFVLLLSATALATYQWIFSSGTEKGDEVVVGIRPGTPARVIAEDLESKAVIDSALAFRIYMRVSGINRDLKAGEYRLRTGMGFADLVELLKKGPEIEFIKVTIPEGFTLDQTAERVGEVTHITKEEFLAGASFATASPKDFEAPPDNSLEGFLYPQTYFLTEKEDAAALVRRMVTQFDAETQDVDWSRASSFGLSPYQVLVVASLIEEETKVDDERRKVSAVIHNRLKLGMKLEIDATVQYITKKYEGQPLTESDLAIDSPYNTRKFAGIPPGPIASVRAGSIVAALDPEPIDALFYVLTPDCRTHLFTADYGEFLAAKQRLPSGC